MKDQKGKPCDISEMYVGEKLLEICLTLIVNNIPRFSMMLRETCDILHRQPPFARSSASFLSVQLLPDDTRMIFSDNLHCNLTPFRAFIPRECV